MRAETQILPPATSDYVELPNAVEHPAMRGTMITVLNVVGTRPECIKMAPVIRALESAGKTFRTLTCVTGQHREMLDQMLLTFGIRPDFDLDIMQQDQSLVRLTAGILTAFEPILDSAQPDWVLVQGDTTTVMAASLVAFYHGIKIGHVEAGLRTWNNREPFPEEVNRKITDGMAELRFAPTDWAARNLLQEGVDEASIVVTGNTVIDALHWAGSQPLPADVGRTVEALLDGEDPNARLILVTAHRRENLGRPLKSICRALIEIANRYADVRVVYPVHLNPSVQRVVRSALAGHPRIHLIDPLPYLAMVHLLKRAYLVLTDSGGLQEEAPAFGVPVLVMRSTTERPEGIEAGTACITGSASRSIVGNVDRLLTDRHAYEQMARAKNPFGDGRASERIAEALALRG